MKDAAVIFRRVKCARRVEDDWMTLEPRLVSLIRPVCNVCCNVYSSSSSSSISCCFRSPTGNDGRQRPSPSSGAGVTPFKHTLNKESETNSDQVCSLAIVCLLGKKRGQYLQAHKHSSVFHSQKLSCNQLLTGKWKSVH